MPARFERDEEDNSIKIIDTSKSLTQEEVKAIKDIIQMTKSAKMVLAIAIAIVTMFGIDKALAVFERILKM